MRHILLILWLLMIAVDVVSAAPNLVYSTMVVDSTWYTDSMSKYDDYAVDVDNEGNLYAAIPFRTDNGRVVRVYRIDPSGGEIETIADLTGYRGCFQLAWRENGIYACVWGSSSSSIFRFWQFVKITPNEISPLTIEYPAQLYANCVDREGNIYIALNLEGERAGQMPVTPDAFDPDYNGEEDIIIHKYSSDGELLYGSFIGGSEDDFVMNLTVDDEGVLYLGCHDTSPDLPIEFTNPEDIPYAGAQPCFIIISPEFDDFQAFYTETGPRGLMERIDNFLYTFYVNDVIKYTLTGAVVSRMDLRNEMPELKDLSFLKPTGQGVRLSSKIIDNGLIYSVSKEQDSQLFTTTPDALYPDMPGGTCDLGIWQVTDDAELLYGTYFGGSREEETCLRARVIRDGRLYVLGYTYSPDFPLTPGAYIDERTPPLPGQNYPWGEYHWGAFAFCIDFNESTDVVDETDTTPAPLTLDPPHPNPFNPATTLSFTLQEAGFAQLAVYNLSGQLVRELAAENLPAGRHEVIWDGRDSDGARVASGIYIARLAAGGRSAVRKVTLVR